MTTPMGAMVMGREYAKQGRPITDCPYRLTGDDPQERVLASRFVRGWAREQPDDFDYDDET